MDESLMDIIHSAIFKMLDSTVFYVPNVWVELCEPKEMDKLRPYINKLIFVSDKGIKLLNEGDNPSSNVMKKSILLDESHFMLYKFKEKLGDGSFAFVVEKYYEIIEVFHFSAEWLNKNVENDIEGLTKEQRLAFQLQYDFHLKHKQEFEKRFQLPKIEMSTNNLVSEKVLSLFNGMVKPSIHNVTNINKIPKQQKQQSQNTQNDSGLEKRTQKRDRMEKLRNETIEKAEKHLLVTVFNVKM